MPLKIVIKNRFAADVKLLKKRPDFNIEKLNECVKQIMSGKPIKTKTFRDRNCKEARVTGDYRLLFRIEPEENELILLRVGRHSDLFR